MSHYKIKTKYNTEGTYGQVEEKNVYAHHNLSCDTVTFYDHNGEFIMTVPDAIDNNILDAINSLYAPFRDLETNKLADGIEYMTHEERELIKKQPKMREIIFRGRRLDNRTLIEGRSILYYGDGTFIYDGELKNNHGNGWMIPFGGCHEVDPETVGQYTEYDTTGD